MRPRGEISFALKSAAQQGPGTVAQLCQRAQVGMSAGRYTASRMVDRGELVVLGAGRPAVVVAADVAPAWSPPQQPPQPQSSFNEHLVMLDRSFWGRAE